MADDFDTPEVFIHHAPTDRFTPHGDQRWPSDAQPSFERDMVSAYDLTCRWGFDLTCWSSACGSWHGVSCWDQGEAVFEAVAGSVDGQDVAVVQEAVQDGGGQDVVAERGPVRRRNRCSVHAQGAPQLLVLKGRQPHRGGGPVRGHSFRC